MYIVKKRFAVNGKEYTTELMVNKDKGTLEFRDTFEQAGYDSLEFSDHDDILKYLDKKFDKNDFVICHDKIFYPENEGDRTLEYFGTIKE